MTQVDEAPPPSSLFRTAVVEKRRQRLYGDIALHESRLNSTFVTLVSIFCITLVTIATTASYPRTTQVQGVVITDNPSSKVFVQRPGIVDRLFVVDGDVVRRGDPIALISVDIRDNDRRSSAGETLTALGAQADSIASQLEALGRSTAGDRDRISHALANNKLEMASLLRQISLDREIVKSMTSSLQRLKPVADRGYMSHVEIERREQALLVQRERLEQLNQQQTQLSTRSDELSSQMRILSVEASRKAAEIRGQLLAVSQQQARTRVDVNYTIVAPISGKITALQGDVGRSVDQRAPIAVVMPRRSKFEAEIFVPSRSAGFLKRGQEVRIMFDAFPYKQFGTYSAHITTISKMAMAPTELNAPFKIEEPVYRARLAFDKQDVARVGERLSLQAGMTLSANIILERRSFLDWLLEPLHAIRTRI